MFPSSQFYSTYTQNLSLKLLANYWLWVSSLQIDLWSLRAALQSLFSDISLDLFLEYKIETMQPAASYIWEKTWSSDPEKFLLNIKLKWAWTKLLNSCFQSLVLLGTDIPKLRPEQETLGTAWAVTHLLKAANISEYAVAWTCRVKKITKVAVYNGIGIFFYVFEWAWSFLYP